MLVGFLCVATDTQCHQVLWCVIPAIVIDMVYRIPCCGYAFIQAVLTEWMPLELCQPYLAPLMGVGLIFSGLLFCSYFYTTNCLD